LRLAVVSPFVDRRHGTERALAELIDRLARKYGCEIHLYSQRVQDLAIDDCAAARGQEAGTIVWHRVPELSGPHLVRFVGWTVVNTAIRWSHRVFRKASFDLVLSPGINCLDADVIIVHVLFHRLRELFCAGHVEASQRIGFWRNLHRQAYYGLLTALERRAYSNHSTSLLAVSQRVADLLRRYFQRSDVSIVSNAVDTGHFSHATRRRRREAARRRRGFQPADLVLLLIGNDWRVKGLPTILQAMARQPNLPLKLLIVGSDAVAPFREMAEQLGVLPRCHWEAPQDNVIDLYAAADVYVSPTHEDSFALPVAEAMACGLPVVTSVFAGVASRIHHGVDGFVLRDPDDARALAKLLERLHRDIDFRHCIGETAARTAQDWTWDGNAAAVWEVLNRIVVSRQHTGRRDLA
jgi:glycosyltransferase involved in cell wall biosynthesis